MRLPAVNRHLSLVLALLLTIVMPVSELAASQQALGAAGGRSEFSGKDLVNGLLLGRGPLVDRFPDLSPASLMDTAVVEPDAERSRVLDAVVERMVQIDPSFLDRFQAEMTSGDPYTIRPAIDDAGALLWRAVGDVARMDRAAGAALTPLTQQLKPSEAHADAVVIALVAVVIILFITVIAVQGQHGPDLAVDRWIERIATKLAP
jgi:SdpC family antimicrobial peptide